MKVEKTVWRMILYSRWVFVPILIFALLAGAGITSALANVVGGYNIDGSVPDVGTYEFTDPYGAIDELGPVNASGTKLGVINTALPPMLAFTNPNAQVDLRKIWLGTNVVANEVWLYFAWERDSSNGSGVIMYEFQQDPAPEACDYSLTDQVTPESEGEITLIQSCNPWQNRQPGDFIIVWDQQGKKINIIKRTFHFNDTNPINGIWDGPLAEPLFLDTGVTLNSTVAVAATSADGYFGEAAINLSKTVFPEVPTSCFSVANIIPGTLTGNSDTADYKDTVLADYTKDIAVSNCGEVQVKKVTDPTGLTGSFPYTLKQANGVIRFDGTTEINETLTKDGDIDNHVDLIADSDYLLTEGLLTSDWALKSIKCQVGTGPNPPEFDITQGGSFPVVASTITYCTITNKQQPGTLIVKKVLTNDNGGDAAYTDFSFTVNGGPLEQFDVDGQREFTVPTGKYTVVETTFPDYATTYENCTDLEIPAGGSATCTITNDDIAPKLTLVKVVINDNGGNAEPDDFHLTIGSNPVTSGVANSLNANTLYEINETQLSGYTFVSITGDDKCPAALGDTVTLDEGDDITCTITNDDVAPTITLNKEVINNNGGDAGANDFGLTIGGAQVSSGQTLQVDANTGYALDEGGLSGYKFVSMTGDANCPSALGGTVTLDEGENITCTITNDDIAPKLTLVKEVINDNGGNALPDDFQLTIDGNAATSGTQYILEANYPYTIGETQLSGYEFKGISGAGCPSSLGDPIILNEGDVVTCTLTNDDIAPKLTLVKEVDNNNGGNAAPDDFHLTIGGGPATSGVAYPLIANTSYAINETQLPGYTFVDITGHAKCPAVLGGEITLDEGENITCTITNDDVAPTLTLIKNVINDNGGNAEPNDFQLTIGGNPATSGLAYPLMANTAYAINETQLPGYTFVSITGEGCPTALGGNITLNEGDDITCTLTNNDIAPKLTLIKDVINDNGGDALPNDFQLTVGGSGVLSGVVNTLNANTLYAIDETQLPGYTFVSITGEGCPTALGGNITLNEGDDITCTITNNDIAPKLTLVKNVINDNGGNALPNDFQLTVGGSGVLSGDANTLNANTPYAINETQLPGYTFVSITGDANCPSALGGTVTLDEGDDITCTITNDDAAPTITLNKEVINNNGGDAGLNDFGLTIGVTTVYSGQTLEVDANTEYALNEAGLEGYTFVSMTGDAKCPVVLGGKVTLDEGENITCTITNDDNKAKPSGLTEMRWVLHDTLTISGLRSGASDAADASVTFFLYSDDQCTNLVGSEMDTTVESGVASTTTGISVPGAGTYYWQAVYSGDLYNDGFTTTCGDEVTQIAASYPNYGAALFKVIPK